MASDVAHRDRTSAEVLRLLKEDERMARPVVARVLRNFREQLGYQSLNVNLLLRKCGLTRAAVAVPFRVDLGQNLSEYIKKTYFEIALWLLFHTKAAIKAVGELAGFSSHRQFQRTLSGLLGISPDELKKRVDLLVESPQLPSATLFSRRNWRVVRKGKLVKTQALEMFDVFQWLYPNAANVWRCQAAEAASRKASHVNRGLMDAFWELLVPLSREERHQVIRKAIRCRTADFFHFLHSKSLEVCREAPDRGVEVMELALESIYASEEVLAGEFTKLNALGLARLANVHRLASDFESARKCLNDARDAWRRVEDRDSSVEAEISFYEATFYLFQGNLREARVLLDRVICAGGDMSGRLLAQCLNQRATIFAYAGDSASAIQDLRVAESVLAHLEEPRLKLTVAGNLALFYVLAGQIAKAEQQLAKAWELHDESGDAVIRQHLLWTQGLIRRARGELEKAASAFEKACRGFEELNQPGYQAMVSLELALVRYEQCRLEEVVGLAAMAIPVLEHFQHVSGVNVALKILRDAIGAQQVTGEVLRQVHTELVALWRNPAMDLGKVSIQSTQGSHPALRAPEACAALCSGDPRPPGRPFRNLDGVV